MIETFGSLNAPFDALHAAGLEATKQAGGGGGFGGGSAGHKGPGAHQQHHDARGNKVLTRKEFSEAWTKYFGAGSNGGSQNNHSHNQSSGSSGGGAQSSSAGSRPASAVGGGAPQKGSNEKSQMS